MNDSEPPIMAKAVQRGGFPWGCLLGGCLSIMALMLIAIVAGGFASYRFYTAQVKKYTAESPVELPSVEYAPEKLSEIQDRVKAFQDAIKNNETPDEFVLTADDINALISENKDLKGHVFVSIGEGQISADVSVETDAIPGAKGRFFNAKVTLNVSLEKGVLIVTVAEAEANGQPVPKAIMDAMAKENLAKDLYKDPKNAEIIRRFESLTIEDNRIILKPAVDKQKDEPKKDQPDDASESAPHGSNEAAKSVE